MAGATDGPHNSRLLQVYLQTQSRSQLTQHGLCPKVSPACRSSWLAAVVVEEVVQEEEAEEEVSWSTPTSL